MKTTIFILAALLCTLSIQAQEIQFEASKIDYGTIEKGADGVRLFKFKNVGETPLVLSDVKASCGCTVPSWSKDPVLPGASGTIEVKYNTQLLGGFSKGITVTSNDSKNGTLQLNISGTVVEAASATPAKEAMFKE